MRFLNIGINDEVFIKVSPDGGLTWKTAWYNSSMILDDTWKLNEVDISSFAARKKKVLIKYALGSTNDYWQLSGWNIDQVTVTGKFVSKDVGVSRIISPVNGCGHTASDSVTIVVKNYGAADSYDIIPLKYSFDGKNTFVYDTLYAVIPFGDSTVFTFKKKADLSVPDLYSFHVSASMAGDDDLSNDAIEKQYYIQPTIATDHTEKFESKGGLWMAHPDEVTNWECGTPGFGIVPPSGSRVWKTRLITYYPNNDSSFIESACYSNPQGKRKILGLKYWADAESHFDGAALQYSTDNGANWNFVDTSYTRWNWYNDTVQAINSRGWSGNSNGWTEAALILPENITDAPLVKFRIYFASNEDTNGIGLAFDDFSVITAPHDVGVTSIHDLADACQGINRDSVTVTITNFGINDLGENDTIIAGFDVNEENVVIDTLRLSSTVKPGETLTYRFRQQADIFEPGEYKITAYTLIEKDPRFYSENNDTAEVEFTVFPNPETLLPDKIQTHFPDTVVLKTIFNSEYDYWWNGIAGNNTYHVDDDGWQYLKVTATRGNGCSATDSAHVELLFNDAGVTDVIHPVDNCGFSTHENPVITIKNFGTDSIYAGQKIAVSFSINAGMPVHDTLELEKALYSGETIDYAFTGGKADLSQKGTYHFKVYTSYGGDTIAVNDTLLRTVEILGRPEVTLGEDITVEALSHTLDAGSGFESYEWDNGITSQTREVLESGLYWVRVLDENMCDNYDTAYVRLKIRDISTAGFVSPLSDCSFEPWAPVIFRVLNSGTDTVPAMSKIAISFKFMQEPYVTDTLRLSEELIPGEEVTATFNAAVNQSEAGDYPIKATVNLPGDLRTSNDTLDYTIQRYPKPVADFGLDATEYVEDISLNIDAGYHDEYTYEWQDTSWHESVFTASESGLVHVRVTDNRTLCYDGDSVMVFLIYSDVGLTWSDMPSGGCTGEFRNVKVKVSNLGPSVIGSSAPIYVACDVNGTRITIDTLLRTGNFNSGAVLEMTLTGSIPVYEEGEKQIAFYTVFAQDKKPANDTLMAIFDALPAPEISFGDVNGNLNVDLPHVLDAGAGNKSYQWQDNSADQTYTVTQAGTYEVTVTGQNDCRTTKTVRVNMQSGSDDAAEEELLIYPNPGRGLFNIRMKEQAEEVTVRIFNNQGSLVYIHEFAPHALQHEQIDVQHLMPGIYHLVIRSGEDTYRGKVVVE